MPEVELASQISKSCEICRILGILGMTWPLSVSLVPDMSVRVSLVSSQKIKMNSPYHRTLKKSELFYLKIFSKANAIVEQPMDS